MHPFSDIPSRPYTFSGALAFNQRTVSGAVESLLGSGPAAVRTPIALSELANVLLLLESIATSTAMCLDGTLPPDDLEKMRGRLDVVHSRSGVAVDVEFLRPSADVLVDMFKSAADAASLLIQESLEHLEQQTDAPMAGDISGFVDALRHAGQSTVADQMARAIADKAAQGIETFRGSKCVAGLMLASVEPVPLLELAAKAVLGAPDALQRKAIGVLVNRFRINYVNSLASMRHAAYLADANIEDLKSQQIVLFSRYFADRIGKEHQSELSAATQELFDRRLSGVPLGFAILMNSRGRTALELVEEAMRLRDASFARAAAGDTPQARFLHQLDDTAFAQFQDYLFREQWSNVIHAAERADLGGVPWRTLRIPFAIGGGAVALTAAGVLALFGPAGVAAGVGLGGMAIANVREFVGRELGATDAAEAVYVDQYRKLDKYFALAARHDRLAQAMSSRVELLFGRPLVAPA